MRARFLGGLACAAVPFAAALVAFGAPFARHVVGYTSSWDGWGFAFLLQRWLEDSHHGALPAQAIAGFTAAGPFLLLGLTTSIGVGSQRALLRDPHEVGALAMAAILVFTPGFAVQYTIYAVPLLFAVSLRWGTLFAFSAGLFSLFVYGVFLEPGTPYYSLFRSGFPMPVARVGLYAWGVLVGFCAVRLWPARRRDPPS
jgi:hypothetical protein